MAMDGLTARRSGKNHSFLRMAQPIAASLRAEGKPLDVYRYMWTTSFTGRGDDWPVLRRRSSF